MEIKNQRKAQLGFWLVLMYISVFIAALCFYLYEVWMYPGVSELSGLGMILLGLPWSTLFVTPILISLGMHNMTLTVLIVSLPVIINAFLIYFIGNFVGNLFQQAILKPSESDNKSSQERLKTLWKRFNIIFWILFLSYYSLFLSVMMHTDDLNKVPSFVYTIHQIVPFLMVLVLAYFAVALSQRKSFVFMGLFGIEFSLIQFHYFLDYFLPLIGYVTMWWLIMQADRRAYSDIEMLSNIENK